jgi:hypothetical protein
VWWSHLAKDLGEDVVQLFVGAVMEGLLAKRRFVEQKLPCWNRRTTF